ncbi:unnamed protein product, partial [Medioppia subpectinata]
VHLRYACFAEIHSIGSSIFDSLVDQIAAETEAELHGSPAQHSKSQNSSHNGNGSGGGHYYPQQQPSPQRPQSGGDSGGHNANNANHFYYSFDNPLNSEQQRNNFLFSHQKQNPNQNSYQNLNNSSNGNQNPNSYHNPNNNSNSNQNPNSYQNLSNFSSNPNSYHNFGNNPHNYQNVNNSYHNLNNSYGSQQFNANYGDYQHNSPQNMRNSQHFDVGSGGHPNHRNSQHFEASYGQNPNAFNAQGVNAANNYPTNHMNNQNSTSAAVWSNTSSSMSNSSQVSGTSSPAPPLGPAPTPPFGGSFGGSGQDMSQSRDRLNESPAVFAELDPLGMDRPFVDRSQFFAEHKQPKPSLRDLNQDLPTNNPSYGTDMSPICRQTTNDQMTINMSSVPQRQQTPYSSAPNANPFGASSASSISNDSNSSRLSPNPFNPFFAANTTRALNTGQTPPPIPQTPPPALTPPPPPRPPSRDCPPVPPRNDLVMSRSAPGQWSMGAAAPVYAGPAPQLMPKPPTPDLAPPLPRRRTILPEHRYQCFETTTNRQSYDPFSGNFSTTNSFTAANNTNTINTDHSSAPPLPNPQRKVTPALMSSQSAPSSTPPTSSYSPSTATGRPQPMARRLSANKNYDPFGTAFVEPQLSAAAMRLSSTSSSSVSNQQFQSSVANSVFGNSGFSDVHSVSSSTQSTPKQWTESVPNIRQQDLKLSEINSRYEWMNETVDEMTPSTDCSTDNPLKGCFVADFNSVFSSPSDRSSPATTAGTGGAFGFAAVDPFKPCKPSKLDLNVRPNSEPPIAMSASGFGGFDEDFCPKFSAPKHCVSDSDNKASVRPASAAAGPAVTVGQDEVSPPERNIFIVKSDPFADEFFA